ncbi:MAG: hypothetical protein LBK41_08485 [Clostridiales bacterium]|jgi:hypothetical protein|nr:hypothetical protein [Clostridiales bacterium]
MFIGIHKCIVSGGTAYVVVTYCHVSDTFVYNLADKTGYWMSGAEELGEFYQSEIAALRELKDRYDVLYGYHNFNLITISAEHGFVLLHRSLYPSTIEGQYIMRNLATGEETVICGSYMRDRDRIVSFMEEAFKWLDADTLRLGVCSNTTDGWATTYDAVYNGEEWVVTEVAIPIGVWNTAD